MKEYIKIWIKHHGKIPKDENGRSYEVHHIDGNNTNNNIENLKLVTIQEHYEIHYAQHDWGACFAITQRMSIDVEEKSRLAKLAQISRIDNGTHHFLGENNPSIKRVKNGTHHLLKREDGTSVASDTIAAGKHNLIDANGVPYYNGEQRLDNTIYTFKNLDTNEIVKLTRKDFVNRYNLHSHQGNLSSMINGKTRIGKRGVTPITKHVKRWIVL
jgi:hypothetical protein